jgi:hypothetical protein
MRRRLPYFTPVSIFIAIALVLGTGFAFWKAGGFGVNPGPVTAKSRPGVVLQGFSSHADLEQDCQRCHQPLTTSQATLCLDCHQTVKQQIETHVAFHSRLPSTTSCATCHAEHKGRDFDPTGAALAGFNHNQSRFPLTGKHLMTSCVECHKANPFQLASFNCVQCHPEPQSHAGMFGQDCAPCHSTSTWKQATNDGKPYDHAKTGFILTHHQTDSAGQPLLCTACHTGNPQKLYDQQTCDSCHQKIQADFEVKHLEQYGPNCIQCHDGADRMVPFDHTRFFPLDGKHAPLDCIQCHAEQKFSGTATACADCHPEPKIHEGNFGSKCQYCHTASAWIPALLSRHTFPLDHGGKSEQSCQTCHLNSYSQYSCYTCHDHQQEEIAVSHTRAHVSQTDPPDCARCHPGGER